MEYNKKLPPKEKAIKAKTSKDRKVIAIEYLDNLSSLFIKPIAIL